LKQTNAQIASLLTQLSQVQHQTPARQASNSATRVSPYEAAFVKNRTKAAELVEKLRPQIQQKQGGLEQPILPPTARRSKPQQMWLSNNIQLVISECVSFMYHLQTCVQNENMTVKDASLLLKAGLLALKPKSVSSNSVVTTTVEEPQDNNYEGIEALVEQIKALLVNK